LDALYRHGLFLTGLGGGRYRYHPLFHAFLRERAKATLPEWIDLHASAVKYFKEVGGGEQVLYHLLAMGDMSGVALELEYWAPGWLRSGRMVTLLGWIDQLPDGVLEARPQLLVARGESARLLGRIDEAQDAYARAEAIYKARDTGSVSARSGRAQALRGEALVCLDTLQPVRAEALLRDAFKLLGTDEQEARAELLGLIAENRLNVGRADQALRLITVAEQIDTTGALRPGHSAIHARILLHLGRLAEARTMLEALLPADRESVSRGRPS
jgi:ATP/maltotriose-dependent transcriptional regulator MalT